MGEYGAIRVIGRILVGALILAAIGFFGLSKTERVAWGTQAMTTTAVN
ncbi:MAG: hypothetical protein ACT4PZ_21895 [Panacagrimonas sp.]